MQGTCQSCCFRLELSIVPLQILMGVFFCKLLLFFMLRCFVLCGFGLFPGLGLYCNRGVCLWLGGWKCIVLAVELTALCRFCRHRNDSLAYCPALSLGGSSSLRKRKERVGGDSSRRELPFCPVSPACPLAWEWMLEGVLARAPLSWASAQLWALEQSMGMLRPLKACSFRPLRYLRGVVP